MAAPERLFHPASFIAPVPGGSKAESYLIPIFIVSSGAVWDAPRGHAGTGAEFVA
jgi:hypothetical protein